MCHKECKPENSGPKCYLVKKKIQCNFLVNETDPVWNVFKTNTCQDQTYFCVLMGEKNILLPEFSYQMWFPRNHFRVYGSMKVLTCLNYQRIRPCLSFMHHALALESLTIFMSLQYD